MDPHFYHPSKVHEHILTNQERREALKDSFRSAAAGIPEPDLLRFLSPAERLRYESLSNSEERPVSSFEVTKSGELLWIARLRRYACQKYNLTERIWCGDGPPPWRRTSL
jgi:hypothetical protein